MPQPHTNELWWSTPMFLVFGKRRQEYQKVQYLVTLSQPGIHESESHVNKQMDKSLPQINEDLKRILSLRLKISSNK